MTASLHRLFVGVFTAAALAGCATTRSVEDATALRVQVNVPTTLNFMLEDRVADLVTDRVEDVFRQNGFARPVSVVPYVEDAAKIPNLLTIDLTEWRLSPTGMVDCTFHARLKTPFGERDLGTYANSALRWAGGFGRVGRAQAFSEALDGAIRSLYLDVARSELLPGVRAKATTRLSAVMPHETARS